MHLFISAGEPSGDLHGSNLIRALRERDPDANIVGLGGQRMADAGANLHYPLTNLAIMWFWRAVTHLPTFYKIGRRAEVYFRSRRPDAVVLIDYPGFNLPLAMRAHRARVPVFYFVPPQLWAWSPGRVKKMRKWVHTVFTALPFEDEWYRSRGVNTRYVGHPYFDELDKQRLDPAFLAEQRAKGGRVVALLPGSRTQEVTANIELILASAAGIREAVPGTRFLVAAHSEAHAAKVRTAAAGSGLPIEIHVGRTGECIELAEASVAVSGSVGFELMYRETPTVVVYKVTPVFKFIAERVKNCKYISLVNLLANEELFPEYTPTTNEPGPVIRQVVEWMQQPLAHGRVVEKLRGLRARAAVPGACGRAADAIAAELAALRQQPRRMAA